MTAGVAAGRSRGSAAQAGTGGADRIETCASSGSITPRIFWTVRMWTQEPQLSK